MVAAKNWEPATGNLKIPHLMNSMEKKFVDLLHRFLYE